MTEETLLSSGGTPTSIIDMGHELNPIAIKIPETIEPPPITGVYTLPEEPEVETNLEDNKSCSLFFIPAPFQNNTLSPLTSPRASFSLSFFLPSFSFPFPSLIIPFLCLSANIYRWVESIISCPEY
ncbi:hypothetical protein RN001_010861 [Aquatica leii]|uniref:Uncharacterized protein n=1 Tax=Aquatica leii TaxID=1421715 RepID=A0AAN7SQI7_9COLE|nr:hypothetical protein RN001_010861 [Aquatica leii]